MAKIKSKRNIRIFSLVISLVVVLFLQSFIKNFSFKVITNGEITIEENSLNSVNSDKFKINSIKIGNELVKLDEADIKGWEMADNDSGYLIETLDDSEENYIKFKPPFKLLFQKMTLDFETGPKYSEGTIKYLDNHVTTMYANDIDKESYVDIYYPGYLSVGLQVVLAILAVIFFGEFLYRIIYKLINQGFDREMILGLVKDYSLNFIVLGVGLSVMFIIKKMLLKDGWFTIFDTPYTFNDIIALLGIVFLASLGLKNIYKNNREGRILSLVNWVLFIINPLVSFYILESAYNPTFQEIEWGFVLINTLILLLIQVFLYVIVRKKRIVMFIILLLSISFGIANDFLYILRDSPLIPAFLGSLGVAADVAKGTVLNVNPSSLEAFTYAIIWILVILSVKEDKVNLKLKTYAKQVGGSLVAFSLIFVLSVSYFIRQSNVGVNLWRPSRTYYVEGAVYSFYRILAKEILTAPDGYDKNKVEETLEAYYNKEVATKEGPKPNIIMIQSEALADYYGKGNIKMNKDPIEFQRSLSENTIQGNTYVSVLGGGTVNSEYEALTSIPLTFFPLGAYPFQQYIKEGHTSIGRVLEDQGYETFITHPNKPTNYSRQEAWPNLGFNNLAFMPDYDQTRKNFTGHDYLKDSVVYDFIKEKYQNKGDKPLFSYIVTMQNHGGYFTNSKGVLKIENDTKGDDKGINDYINLVKSSDDAFRDLVKFFEKYDEPTIICIFGDHQPQNYAGFMDLIKSGGEYDNSDIFYTPLTIWANYDIEEEKNVNISLNYLTPYLLEKAGGIKLSAYQKYLLEMKEDYPILTTKQIYDKKGREVSEDSEFMERNNKLNSLIYYEIKQGDKSEKYFDQASK